MLFTSFIYYWINHELLLLIFSIYLFKVFYLSSKNLNIYDLKNSLNKALLIILKELFNRAIVWTCRMLPVLNILKILNTRND